MFYAETLTQQLLDLTAVLASANWTAPKVHLSTGNIVPTPLNVLADFTPDEATFVGYAATSITFSAPYVDGSGNVVAVGTVSFHATSGATPNTLYCFYLTNTAGSLLLCAGQLDGNPIPIVNSGDGFTLAIAIQLGKGQSQIVG